MHENVKNILGAAAGYYNYSTVVVIAPSFYSWYCALTSTSSISQMPVESESVDVEPLTESTDVDNDDNDNNSAIITHCQCKHIKHIKVKEVQNALANITACYSCGGGGKKKNKTPVKQARFECDVCIVVSAAWQFCPPSHALIESILNSTQKNNYNRLTVRRNRVVRATVVVSRVRSRRVWAHVARATRKFTSRGEAARGRHASWRRRRRRR